MLSEARDREVQIREEFASILDSLESGLPQGLDSSWFNEQSFIESFAVVVAHSIYLPSAQCFALVPYTSFMGRTGNDNGCEVDYDTGAATAPFRLCEARTPAPRVLRARAQHFPRCHCQALQQLQ